jgi:hypothetical protein
MDNNGSLRRKTRIRYFVAITFISCILTPISTFIRPELGVLVGLLASYIEYILIFDKKMEAKNPILYVAFAVIVTFLSNYIILSIACSLGTSLICMRNFAFVSIYPGGLLLVVYLLLKIYSFIGH